LAEGHAVDHDVKEAPDDEPEQNGRDDDHKSPVIITAA